MSKSIHLYMNNMPASVRSISVVFIKDIRGKKVLFLGVPT